MDRSPSSAHARSGPLLLVIASFVFGQMAVVAKLASSRLPGPEVAAVRFAVGVLAIAVAVVAGLRLRPRNFRGLFLRGLFGGVAVLFYFTAIAHLAVGTATLLNYSAPVFTAVFAAAFLGERVTALTAAALVVTLGGVVLLVHGHAPPGRFGFGRYELCGVGSAVLSGAAVTTVRAVRRTDGSWEIFAAFCVVGLLATAPVALPRWVPPSPTEWALLVVMGLLAVIAQVLFTYALRFVPAATSGVISQLTPVTALGTGVLFLGEPLSAVSAIGAGVVLAGVVLGGRRTESPRT